MCYSCSDCYSCSNCGNCSNCPELELKRKRENNAKEISEELKKYRDRYRQDNIALEKDLIDVASKGLSIFLEKLAPLNNKEFGGKKLEINIPLLQKKQKEMERKITGHIGDIFDEELVSSNKELQPIIKEVDDNKRKTAFNAFCDRVHRKAILSLGEVIEKAMNEQKVIMRTEIENRIQEVKRSLEVSQKEYQKILAMDEKNSKEKEKLQTEYMYMCDVYSILESQFTV